MYISVNADKHVCMRGGGSASSMNVLEKNAHTCLVLCSYTAILFQQKTLWRPWKLEQNGSLAMRDSPPTVLHLSVLHSKTLAI